jgi:hypothetical protein
MLAIQPETVIIRVRPPDSLTLPTLGESSGELGSVMI